jgi:FkbM family methyltransferase
MKRKILATLLRILNTSFLFDLKSMRKLYYLVLRSKSRVTKLERNLLLVSDDTHKIFASRKNRLNLFYNGIEKRLVDLQQQYLTIELNSLNIDEYVIDIGANIGEFSFFWENKGHKVIAFEPDPIEYKCLNKNIKGITNNLALWNKNGNMNFYLNNKTGDSSLIKSENYKTKIEIKVDTLDSYMSKIEGSVGLIKLEAEGGEPEILIGAFETLKRTRFISVDVGLERGIKKESTLMEVCNLLFKNEFEIIDFNPNRYTLLFKKNHG